MPEIDEGPSMEAMSSLGGPCALSLRLSAFVEYISTISDRASAHNFGELSIRRDGGEE